METRSRSGTKEKASIPTKKVTNNSNKSKSSVRKQKTVVTKPIKVSKPEEEEETVVEESSPSSFLSNQKQQKQSTQSEPSGTSALFDKLLVEHCPVIKTYSRIPSIKTLADVQLEGLSNGLNVADKKTKKKKASTALGKKKNSQKVDSDIASKRKRRESKK